MGNTARKTLKRRYGFMVRETISLVKDAISKTNSYEETVRLLNDNGVLTSQGRKWKTQNLYRFRKQYIGGDSFRTLE